MTTLQDMVVHLKRVIEDAIKYNLIYANVKDKLEKDELNGLLKHATELNDAIPLLEDITNRLRTLKFR